MKNFSKILALTAISAVSTIALANGDNYHHHPINNIKEGFVLGVDFGYGFLSSPEEMYPDNYRLSETSYKYSHSADLGSYIWGAHIGYDFKVKPYMLMGFELGYKDLGDSRQVVDLQQSNSSYFIFQGSRKYDQTAVDLMLTAHRYIYKGLNVFGKAGLAYVSSEVKQSATSDTDDAYGNLPFTAETGNNTIWRLEPELSIGAGYSISNNFDIHLAYTYIGGANDQPIVEVYDDMPFLPKAKVYSSNIVMLGLSYTF